jgi:hypothetical protein
MVAANARVENPQEIQAYGHDETLPAVRYGRQDCNVSTGRIAPLTLGGVPA